MPTLALPTRARLRIDSPVAALALLAFVYLLNFLDRTLIFILFTPIRKEMAFSDLELALLGSTSFVLFYSTLGIPFGRLADRVSRPVMIAAGLAVWSLFSGLTGYSTGFWSMFLCRVMVGVGEATLGPAAMSLLADLFPANRRATVQSVYSAGVPLGAAAAFFLGGELSAIHGWRTVFPLLGFPGIALALVVLRLREPRNEGAALAAVATAAGVASQGFASKVRDTLQDLGALFRIPAFKWHVAGYACLAIAANSLGIWVPSMLSRSFELPIAQIGRLSGGSMLVAGGLATLFGGALADRWRTKHPGGRLRFSAALAIGAAAAWALLLLAPTVTVASTAFFLLAGLGLAWLGPAAADVHSLAPERSRGLAIAAYFLVVNLIGYGVAPVFVGALSDSLAGWGGIRAALVVSPLACCVAAWLLWQASNRMVAGR